MQQLIVLGALSLAFHWVAQFYCDNRLHSEFCTPSVCTCQIVWAQARKHACTFWAGRVCFPCVFANLCALDVSACARAGWGARERERFRMRCALRRVCLHHVMLERAQSVRVWDRWLALLPKVLLLFCILYLLPIRQTALRRVPTFCLFACRCAVCGVYVCACRLFVIAHGTVSSSIFVQVCVRTRGEVWCCVGAQGFCSMLSWEMKSGKCSGVKTLPHRIQCRGDTQTPTAKWCRSSLWLQAVESCRDAHIPQIDTHTDTLGAADRSSAEVKSCHK